MVNCNLKNWNKKCEDIVNKQIQIEYWASYQYHLMWSHFDKSDVALKNIADFFKKSSEEEREHAHKLMEYQNLRGGKVVLTGVPGVNLDFLNDSSNQILSSFEEALRMEQKVYQSLLEVHKTAEESKDPQFTDFIESEYLQEQIEALNQVSLYVTQLEYIGNNSHGLWHFDQTFKN